MLTAITGKGTKLTATEAVELPRHDYFCPKCGGVVNLRNGLVKVEHFGHNPGNSC